MSAYAGSSKNLKELTDFDRIATCGIQGVREGLEQGCSRARASNSVSFTAFPRREENPEGSL